MRSNVTPPNDPQFMFSLKLTTLQPSTTENKQDLYKKPRNLYENAKVDGKIDLVESQAIISQWPERFAI